MLVRKDASLTTCCALSGGK